MALTFPYRLYPLSSGKLDNPYANILYNSNVIILKDFLERQLSVMSFNTLNIFIIGSLLDDEDSSDPVYSASHKNQHIPLFLFNYLKTNSNPINIIVISPSKNRRTPAFINLTNDIYNWNKINDIRYNSRNYSNLNYFYFYCPIPEYQKDDFEFKLDLLEQKKYYIIKPNNVYIPKIFYGNTKKFIKLIPGTETNYEMKNRDEVLERNRVLYDIALKNLKSSTTEVDKIFVSQFYHIIDNFLIKSEQTNSTNFVLNYAVFRDQWASRGLNFFYFYKTFYDKLKRFNIRNFHYNFRGNSTSLLDEDKVVMINYNDPNLILNIIDKNNIEINEIPIEEEEEEDVEEEIISSGNKSYPVYYSAESSKGKKGSTKSRESNNFDILENQERFFAHNILFEVEKVDKDGDCLFNAVIKQINDNYNVIEERVRIVNYIKENDELTNEIYRNLEAEGLYTSAFIYFRRELDSNDNSEIILKKEIMKLYFIFMRSNSNNLESEMIRRRFNLDQNVYYGGHVEIKAMIQLYNINIYVLEGSIEDNIITKFNNIITDKTIYIIHSLYHFDIAKVIH